MDDLTAFWTARLDEDEAAARATATEHADGPDALTWSRGGRRVLRFDNGRSENYESVFAGNWDRILVARDDVLDAPLAAHIARYDPARMLREVAVLRILLGDHHPTQPYGDFGLTYPAAAGYCATCGPGDNWRIAAEPDDWEFARWPCTRARQGVSIWSDHPDYQQEWALAR